MTDFLEQCGGTTTHSEGAGNFTLEAASVLHHE